MSKCLKGRIKTAEHKQKLSLAKIGRPSVNKGRKIGPIHNEEHKRNMSLKYSGAFNPRSVKVIDDCGNLYLTIKEASEKLKLNRNTVINYLKKGVFRRA